MLTLPTVERLHDAPAPQVARRTLSEARVLAVDDEPSVRTLLSAMGKRFACSIEAVSTSDAAIEAVRQARAAGRPFDIAVLDLTMPGDRNGHATFELLRAEDPAIRGVVTSGYHDDPVLARHVDFGFAARLEKPFSLQSLQEALQQALDAT